MIRSRQPVSGRRLADCLRARAVVEAKSPRPVVAHERVQPGDSVVGVAFDDVEIALRALAVGREPEPVRELRSTRYRGIHASSLEASRLGGRWAAHIGAAAQLASAAYLTCGRRRKPEADGLGGRSARVAHGELAQDRRDVMFDRPSGEDEAVCDLGVGEILAEQDEHLELALGEVGGIVAGRRPRPRGSPRKPRSRRRRATIAAAGRASSRGGRRAPAEGGPRIGAGERKRRFVRRVRALPRARPRAARRRELGRPRVGHGDAAVPPATPARRRQQASSPTIHGTCRRSASASAASVIAAVCVRSALEPGSLRPRRRGRLDPLQLAGRLGEAHASSSSGHASGSPRRARTSPARTARGPAARERCEDREGRRRRTRLRSPQSPRSSCRRDRNANANRPPKLQAALAAERERALEAAVGVRVLAPAGRPPEGRDQRASGVLVDTRLACELERPLELARARPPASVSALAMFVSAYDLRLRVAELDRALRPGDRLLASSRCWWRCERLA